MISELDKKIDISIQAERDLYEQQVLAQESIVVATYELGKVAHNLLYARSCLDKKDIGAYCSESCIELADLITQALMIFGKIKSHTKTFKDYPAEQLITDGLERQVERMMEHKKAGFNKGILI
jgi:hypothetical protein